MLKFNRNAMQLLFLLLFLAIMSNHIIRPFFAWLPLPFRTCGARGIFILVSVCVLFAFIQRSYIRAMIKSKLQHCMFSKHHRNEHHEFCTPFCVIYHFGHDQVKCQTNANIERKQAERTV